MFYNRGANKDKTRGYRDPGRLPLPLRIELFSRGDKARLHGRDCTIKTWDQTSLGRRKRRWFGIGRTISCAA
jgi:hypothetical protein